MSSEIVLTIYYLAILVSVAILAMGTFRAFQVGRFFVNRTYRSRAYTGGALMFLIMLATSLDLVSLPHSALVVTLSFLPFSAVIIFLMAFLDQGILVAMDGDIFHRSILGWRSTRLAVYAVIVASVAFSDLVTVGPFAASSPIAALGTNQFLVLTPFLFAYAVVSLLVGGRRTSNRTMKKHIRLLAAGFVCFIVAFPFFASTADAALIFSNVVIIFANWFLYRAVMSLSDMGKVAALEPATPSPAVMTPA